MAEIERNWTHWQQVAQDLFLDASTEQTKKAFFAKYSEPSALYLELARGIVEAEIEVGVATQYSDLSDIAERHKASFRDSIAYTVMQEAFTLDAKNNNTDKLDELVINYQAIAAGESK